MGVNYRYLLKKSGHFYCFLSHRPALALDGLRYINHQSTKRHAEHLCTIICALSVTYFEKKKLVITSWNIMNTSFCFENVTKRSLRYNELRTGIRLFLVLSLVKPPNAMKIKWLCSFKTRHFQEGYWKHSRRCFSGPFTVKLRQGRLRYYPRITDDLNVGNLLSLHDNSTKANERNYLFFVNLSYNRFF